MSSEKKPKSMSKMSFEECFTELEQLVEIFEKGKMPLADMLSKFERGMLLIQQCTSQLNDAEKKVNALLARIDPDTGIETDGIPGE